MRGLVFAIFILTIISNESVGQTTSFGFQEGTITTKDGNSIKGYVEFAVTYYSRVAYKMTQEGNELSIKSSEIKSIQTPYKYIENITLDNKERLMALVTDGHVRLFNHITVNPGQTKKGYGGTYNFSAPPTIIYALKKGENLTEIVKKDFKSKLLELLNDQPSIVDRLNNNEFKFEDMEKIISEYNDIHKMQALRRQIIAKVVDSETKKPIRDVKVTIQGTDVMATTNFLGFIQITIDKVDTLLIEHPEYEIGLVKVPETNSFSITLTRTNFKK
jgi:hypothetical protein